WLLRAEEDNFIAVDLSQPSTAEDGRLAVAGVNLEQIDGSERMLVSPHPVAIPIALILHQVARLARVDCCTATVGQPASELEQLGTTDEAGKDEVVVAEVRRDPSIAGGFWVWAVCDNLRRGSALNAVLIAEKVLFATGVPN